MTYLGIPHRGDSAANWCYGRPVGPGVGRAGAHENGKFLKMNRLRTISHDSKGNSHRNPGKRRKSWSAVWTVAPCAKASAAI